MATVPKTVSYVVTAPTPANPASATKVVVYAVIAPTPAPPEPPIGDSLRLRVWGYSLDGHDYYVLRLGLGETLVYDLTTGTWSSWKSPGRNNWRAHIGQNWVNIGPDTVANNFGSDVVAGDANSGVLWILDPTTGRDDRTTTGDDEFDRIVTGGVKTTGRDTIPCGAVTLDLAVGNPTQALANITLEISDDLGYNWTDMGSVTTTATDYETVIEWRGLGHITSSGRLFRLTDNGASVRINGMTMR